MDNTSITFEDLYSNYLSMISSDKRFKNIGSATLIGMYLEMLAATSDMASFNIQRMIEEGFFRTARLDSSFIKLCKNWGYAPRRAVPAQGELIVELRGPFPKELKNLPAGETFTIGLANDQCKLSFLDMPFRLTDSLKYTFSESDIKNCTNSTWSKRFKSVKIDSLTNEFEPLDLTRDPVNNATRFPIKCYQGEIKTVVFNGEEYITDLNNTYEKGYQEKQTDINLGQRFDINDLTFSNWYGIRDPFAVKYRRKNLDSSYSPNNGLTRVYTRFKNSSDMKIFDIEDRSILLNKKILENFDAIPAGDSRPCICCIETNPDKTVSINFGPYSYLSQLAIEGRYNDKLDITEYPDLYIDYLSTNGAFANKNGIKESKLTNSAKLYLHTSIGVFDITNNINFLFAGDLIGGENFESKEDMYDNAEAYWTSQLKLVSKRDFINYFNSLTSPIDVLCALVYGLRELDTSFEVNQFKKRKDQVYVNTKDINLNYLFYTLASHMYINIGKNVYMPRNIFVKDSQAEWINDGFVPEIDNMENPATMYCDEYNAHIADYIKSLISPEAFYNYYALLTTPGTAEDSQFLKNIREVTENINRLTPTNTVVMSLPPFLHYYDLVGTIEVDAGTTDLEDYKEKLQTKIYKYLDTLTLETREIYKSNLIKLCMDEDHVVNANLDLKVSDIISPTFSHNSWNETDQLAGVRIILNMEKLTDAYKEYKNIANYPNDLIFNEIIIPKTDSNQKWFDTNNLTEESTLYIDFQYYAYISGYNKNNIKNTVSHASKFTFENDPDSKYIKIFLHTPYIGKQNILPPIMTTHKIFNSTTSYLDNYAAAEEEIEAQLRAELIKYNENPDTCKMYNILAADGEGGFKTVASYGNNYWSDSKYEVTESRATEYGLSLDKLKEVNDTIVEWMNGLQVRNTADRSIDLPYTIKSFDVVTRSETIMRRGDLITNLNDTLSEKGFWNYLITTILNKYYNNSITETTEIYSDPWKKAELLIIDLYKLFKPGITDSILDDNNNVVNYSMDQDIAIIRCRFDVKYQSRT